MTEIDIRFAVCHTDEHIVDVEVSVGALKGYAGEWTLVIALPKDDTRRLRAGSSMKEASKGISVTEDATSRDAKLVVHVRVEKAD